MHGPRYDADGSSTVEVFIDQRPAHDAGTRGPHKVLVVFATSLTFAATLLVYSTASAREGTASIGQYGCGSEASAVASAPSTDQYGCDVPGDTPSSPAGDAPVYPDQPASSPSVPEVASGEDQYSPLSGASAEPAAKGGPCPATVCALHGLGNHAFADDGSKSAGDNKTERRGNGMRKCGPQNCRAEPVPEGWKCTKFGKGKRGKVLCQHPLYGKKDFSKIDSEYCTLLYNGRGRMFRPKPANQCGPASGGRGGKLALTNSRQAVDIVDGLDRQNSGGEPEEQSPEESVGQPSTGIEADSASAPEGVDEVTERETNAAEPSSYDHPVAEKTAERRPVVSALVQLGSSVVLALRERMVERAHASGERGYGGSEDIGVVDAKNVESGRSVSGDEEPSSEPTDPDIVRTQRKNDPGSVSESDKGRGQVVSTSGAQDPSRNTGDARHSSESGFPSGSPPYLTMGAGLLLATGLVASRGLFRQR